MTRRWMLGFFGLLGLAVAVFATSHLHSVVAAADSNTAVAPKAASASKTAANAKAVPSPKPASVLLRAPHVLQKADFCGEACAAMWLQKLGRKVTQDDVFNASGLDPLEGRGCYTKELVAALNRLGFRPGAVWYPLDAAESAPQIEAHWKRLYADLVAGVPSIVCMHFDATPQATEHFRLILGYDAATDTVVYHEPAEAAGAYRHMPRSSFLAMWPLSAGPAKTMLVRMRLETADAVAEPRRPAAAAQFTPADYAQHILLLKRKLPKGFTTVITPPFVVIGDESPSAVRRRAEGTVQWAVEKLKKSYFTRDPEEILDIWLFKDKESYQKYCKSIFQTTPDTPFGYFSHVDRALIMNISTGGGTLVHEIVHPFVAANFPDCPSWFNEGLGSLYEQSGEEDGRIHGYTNWRLPGLQTALREKRVPSFKALTATTTNEFYEKDKGTNYAQARYICYYLQQKGLLEKYYRRFLADHATDPSGYKTLLAVLGMDDKQMPAFEKDWAAYCLKLRFPER